MNQRRSKIDPTTGRKSPQGSKGIALFFL